MGESCVVGIDLHSGQGVVLYTGTALFGRAKRACVAILRPGLASTFFLHHMHGKGAVGVLEAVVLRTLVRHHQGDILPKTP